MENSNKEHWNNPQPVKKITKLAAGILASWRLLEFISSF
jgi:hypothetical protein